MQIIEFNADMKTLSYDGNTLGAARGVGYETGNTFEGKVIFASGTHANVKLPNGAVIRARLEDGVHLNTGDAVRLTVKENDGMRIILELSGSPGAHTDGGEEIIRVLSKLGLPVTKENLILAAAIKEGGFPFRSELMEQSAAIVAKSPEGDVRAAVFVAANDLEPTPLNLGLVEALIKSELKTGQLLGTVLDALRANGVPLDAEGLNRQAPGLPEGNAEQPVQMRNAELPVGKGSAAISAEEGAWIGQNHTPAASVPVTGNEGSRTSGSGAAVSPQPASRNAGLETFIIGKETGARGLENRIFVQAEALPQGQKIQEALLQLPGRLDTLKAYAERITGEGGQDAVSSLDRLTAGIKLFQSINQFAYVQIPVLLGQKRETAELFVFRRKKGIRKTKQEELKVILALDTAHMGRVEAVMRIKNSGVSILFRLESEQVADYIREHTVRLNKLLIPCGFRLTDIRFQTGQEEITTFHALAFLQQEEEAGDFRINVRV